MPDPVVNAPAAPTSSATAALAGDITPAAAPAAAPPAAPPADAAAPPAPAGLTLPGKDATPEQWAEFYGKIGRPETPDGYEFQVPDGGDKALMADVAATMHEFGLTKEQAQGLHAKLSEKVAEREAKAEETRLAALETKNKAEEAELKTELGDKFDGQRELARRAVRQFANPEQAADVLTAIEDKIGYKATMKLWMSIGAGLGEHDATATGAPNGGTGERIPTQQVLYGGTSQKA